MESGGDPVHAEGEVASVALRKRRSGFLRLGFWPQIAEQLVAGYAMLAGGVDEGQEGESRFCAPAPSTGPPSACTARPPKVRSCKEMRR